MTAGTDQQTARVNVDAMTWRAFRILAIDADRSIADYLGRLVRDELRRARRRSREEQPARTPDSSDGVGAAPIERKPVRLADAEVLTVLPHPAGSSRIGIDPRGMMDPDRGRIEGRDDA